MTAITSPVEKGDEPAFELEAQPGLASLRKLLNGFCGGGLVKDQGLESSADQAAWNRATEEIADAVSTPKLALPEQSTESVASSGNSSTTSASDEKAVPPDETKSLGEPKSEPEILEGTTDGTSGTEDTSTETKGVVETMEIDDTNSLVEDETKIVEENEEGVEVVADVPGEAVEVVSRELKIDRQEDTPVTESTQAKSSSGMFYFLTFTVLMAIIAVVAIGTEGGEFQLDKSMQNLQYHVQQFMESELVESTRKLIQLDEIVTETVESSKQPDQDEAETAAEGVEECIHDAPGSEPEENGVDEDVVEPTVEDDEDVLEQAVEDDEASGEDGVGEGPQENGVEDVFEPTGEDNAVDTEMSAEDKVKTAVERSEDPEDTTDVQTRTEGDEELLEKEDETTPVEEDSADSDIVDDQNDAVGQDHPGSVTRGPRKPVAFIHVPSSAESEAAGVKIEL